jgi:hypothetical protein
MDPRRVRGRWRRLEAAQGDQPFGHLFLPLIHSAEARLGHRWTNPSRTIMTPSARNCLAQKLFRRRVRHVRTPAV